MAYLSQGPLSLSLRLFGLRLQRRWLKINISSGLTANIIWCVPQRGYGIVDFRMDSRPQETQVYTFVENAGGDDEMVEVGWGVGVGLLVSWIADEFHFSQSDELCCKIHDFFFCFKEADRWKMCLVRLEYLYVDGLWVQLGQLLGLSPDVASLVLGKTNARDALERHKC